MSVLKTKKERTRDWLAVHLEEIHLSCHHCGNRVQLEDDSLVCPQGHRVDSHRQGTYFLTQQSADRHYGPSLFQARRRFIQESGFYSPLQKELDQLLRHFQAQHTGPYRLLDAGSGEGSHLAWLLGQDAQRVGIGIDLARAGIALSTDYNGTQLNLVGDLAHLPIEAQQVEAVLSILSPANYQEFNRVLVPGGHVLKVVPNPGYLAEIRHVLGQGGQDTSYDNDAVVVAFERHYPDYQAIQVTAQRCLSAQAKRDLVAMTPLTWHLTEEEVQAMVHQLPEEFMLDVTLLVGCRS